MSLISEQIQELRNLAGDAMCENEEDNIVRALQVASGIIGILSAKLTSANMERSSAYYSSKSSIDTDKVVQMLDKLKESNPDIEIIVETPNGTSSCKIGDALIYEGMGGEIVFDSE